MCRDICENVDSSNNLGDIKKYGQCINNSLKAFFTWISAKAVEKSTVQE